MAYYIQHITRFGSDFYVTDIGRGNPTAEDYYNLRVNEDEKKISLLKILEEEGFNFDGFDTSKVPNDADITEPLYEEESFKRLLGDDEFIEKNQSKIEELEKEKIMDMETWVGSESKEHHLCVCINSKGSMSYFEGPEEFVKLFKEKYPDD